MIGASSDHSGIVFNVEAGKVPVHQKTDGSVLERICVTQGKACDTF